MVSKGADGSVVTTDLTGDCKTYSGHTAGLLAFGWVLYFLVFTATASLMYDRCPLDRGVTVKICVVLSSIAWFFYLTGWAQYAAEVPGKCNFDNAAVSAHKGPSFSFTVFCWLLLTGWDFFYSSLSTEFPTAKHTNAAACTGSATIKYRASSASPSNPITWTAQRLPALSCTYPLPRGFLCFV